MSEGSKQEGAQQEGSGQPARVTRRTPRPAGASKSTSIRLDADVEERLRRVADLKKIPYQTLLKQFVGERLYEEEKRLGLL